MNRSAFTMLELVFVIVIIAILGVLALPSFNKNDLELAAEQVASDIRYTQHLAMRDDKFDPANGVWYEDRWQIKFYSGGKYAIFHNNDENSSAKDPATNKNIDTQEDSPSSLFKKFNISEISATKGGDAIDGDDFSIAFDNLGRPYEGIGDSPSDKLLKENIDIKLENQRGELKLRVHSETGYVCLLDPTNINPDTGEEECVKIN